MELDSKGLSRLRRVANPRDVWTSESGDFTPWLADNIDVLAAELGMTLTVTTTEAPVGEFRLDILAEDQEGRKVVIENQLERTDHSHLGQCIVYAAGLEASTVVWVSPSFRDDFRRALDWLNERTDLGVNFFGVEVGLVQVGEDGPRAPVFEVVARPNNWQKEVKGERGPSAGAMTTPTNAKRQQFFSEVMIEVVKAVPEIRPPTPSRQSYISFASGPFGFWAMAAASQNRLRVEVYIDSNNGGANTALFDEFFRRREKWNEEVGVELDWERLDGKRACRIAAYNSLDIEDESSIDEARGWATATLIAMYKAMNGPLRDAARRLKNLGSSADADSANWNEPDQDGPPPSEFRDAD